MQTCGAAPADMAVARSRVSRLRMAPTDVNLLFRAFSDRTRLRILHLLSRGEVCVGDLVKVLRVPQPTASRHLAYLRRAALVETRKEGLWTYYSLAPARGPFHRNLLDCLGTCFREVPELAADSRRHGRLRKSGGCCP
jgi:ArsR family transcriptional regulator